MSNPAASAKVLATRFIAAHPLAFKFQLPVVAIPFYQRHSVVGLGDLLRVIITFCARYSA